MVLLVRGGGGEREESFVTAAAWCLDPPPPLLPYPSSAYCRPPCPCPPACPPCSIHRALCPVPLLFRSPFGPLVSLPRFSLLPFFFLPSTSMFSLLSFCHPLPAFISSVFFFRLHSCSSLPFHSFLPSLLLPFSPFPSLLPFSPFPSLLPFSSFPPPPLISLPSLLPLSPFPSSSHFLPSLPPPLISLPLPLPFSLPLSPFSPLPTSHPSSRFPISPLRSSLPLPPHPPLACPALLRADLWCVTDEFRASAFLEGDVPRIRVVAASSRETTTTTSLSLVCLCPPPPVRARTSKGRRSCGRVALGTRTQCLPLASLSFARTAMPCDSACIPFLPFSLISPLCSANDDTVIKEIPWPGIARALFRPDCGSSSSTISTVGRRVRVPGQNKVIFPSSWVCLLLFYQGLAWTKEPLFFCRAGGHVL
ncbi:hypothetical protein C7M84_008835 [Penaeus vannamei]|uniref:Uncharacterized protein n=1 Tax=Penaeus vannamei TaxID=6689 RepID=A0A423T8J6_PENVA|nr:hypothetical protein C7M84_008835 [Penaeus vannamei]